MVDWWVGAGCLVVGIFGMNLHRSVSYEEEDTCSHMRRRIHGCLVVGIFGMNLHRSVLEVSVGRSLLLSFAN
jgi:hypothetical protein